ncbi:C45 family peptidase [Tsukamurella sp. USMM236]|uniref:C45 family peptidase n=1 Tax=Tsukamurella sp. USMM236 TaxID=3081301 RepID=UPI00301AFA67
MVWITVAAPGAAHDREEDRVQLHTDITTTPTGAAAGRARGARFAPRIRRISALYAAHFAELGIAPGVVAEVAAASHDELAAWAPHLAAEVDGLAAGAGTPLAAVALLDARTEILARTAPSREGECSTMVRAVPGAAPETLQTWDWHDHLAPDGLLLAGVGNTGLRFKLFTEFGVSGKIGLNDAGVGVHFNILNHRSDGGALGVPVHAVARRVIEEATGVDHAVDLVRSARVSASTVLTVADRHGRAASIEMSPAGTALVRPGEDGWLFHTNHFLDPGLAVGDTIPRVESSTDLRMDDMTARRADLCSGTGQARAKALAADGTAPQIMRPDVSLPLVEQWSTLLTVALDLDAFALSYRAGTPFEAAELGLLTF